MHTQSTNVSGYGAYAQVPTTIRHPSYSTAQRRRSPSLQALGVLAFRWEWIVGAGAILLFITLASAFVSYEPICRPYCSMNRTSWQLQSKQDEHPLDLKLASNQNPSPTRAMRVEVEPFS